ncbi:uncharacterized protein EURHEDRAFT_535362 [Aspergillus ruber CBS 135680]|uniref:Uncharacterized protein n=1 Tax=Aspergillus ruber (strain CBS 135680) TaxID=1388766 RepID=A0A017SS04_ASPRC|nr:uncharacterized protein EURHEDRAFT_535362 [Aspergillus ruber CBS 135680]EYE99777.1 hypothetical protein EURHEDRAFT_535362 [Aspergillus ruber CBS 135680]
MAGASRKDILSLIIGFLVFAFGYSDVAASYLAEFTQPFCPPYLDWGQISRAAAVISEQATQLKFLKGADKSMRMTVAVDKLYDMCLCKDTTAVKSVLAIPQLQGC